MAWAEVPPGSGTITIITTKQKAVSTASRGMVSSRRAARRRRRAVGPQSRRHAVGRQIHLRGDEAVGDVHSWLPPVERSVLAGAREQPGRVAQKSTEKVQISR